MNISTTMRELSIDKESFRVLGLLPLVYVAWADGTMQRAERAKIRKIARTKGWLAGGGESLLDGWLETPPTSEYAETALALLRELAAKKRGISASLTTETLQDLLALCSEVAEAAGGHLGFGDSISDAEASALGEVAEALGIADADSWQVLVEERGDQPQAPSPDGHFLLGDAPALLADALGFLMRCAREHGDVTRLRLPGARVFLLTNPEHVKYVLTDNARNYIRGKNFDPFRPVLRESILTTSGETWRRFRKLAQPAFHHRAVASMAEMMVRCTNEMCDGWAERAESGEAFNIIDEIQPLTLRIIGHALFGLDLQGESNREFTESVEIGLENAADRLRPIRIPDMIPTPKNLRFKRASEYFDDTVRQMIESRRAAEELGTDLLGMLLSARDEDTGEGLSDEHIRNEVITYLVAGHETTATTLTWLFYLLSKNPLAARQLDAEHAEVLGGRAPVPDDMDNLPYTTMVIQETMRLYPAAFLTSRELVAEDRIGGFTLPAGAWVMMSPYVTQRLPNLWENPEGFDPERFTQENSEGRHPCAYFPFLAGPHKCIGQALSMLEMRTVLSVVRQRYRLDIQPGFEPEYDAMLTLRAKHGIQMTAVARG